LLSIDYAELSLTCRALGRLNHPESQLKFLVNDLLRLYLLILHTSLQRGSSKSVFYWLCPSLSYLYSMDEPRAQTLWGIRGFTSRPARRRQSPP
jgi:hypothetical protein